MAAWCGSAALVVDSGSTEIRTGSPTIAHAGGQALGHVRGIRLRPGCSGGSPGPQQVAVHHLGWHEELPADLSLVAESGGRSGSGCGVRARERGTTGSWGRDTPLTLAGSVGYKTPGYGVVL